MLDAVSLPADALFRQDRAGIFGNVDQIREVPIDAVTFRLDPDKLGVIPGDVVKRPAVVADAVDLKLFAQVEAGKRQRSARMFLFDIAHQIGRIANLRFNFFLAVAEVIVGDQRDDHSGLGAARDLEGVAVVVAFALISPAHAISSLPLARLVIMGQTQFLLRQRDQVRRQDHGPGVTGPMDDVEPRVVFRHERIARVAEDRLDEIQIADQRTRCKKAQPPCASPDRSQVRPDRRAAGSTATPNRAAAGVLPAVKGKASNSCGGATARRNSST